MFRHYLCGFFVPNYQLAGCIRNAQITWRQKQVSFIVQKISQRLQLVSWRWKRVWLHKAYQVPFSMSQSMYQFVSISSSHRNAVAMEKKVQIFIIQLASCRRNSYQQVKNVTYINEDYRKSSERHVSTSGGWKPQLNLLPSMCNGRRWSRIDWEWISLWDSRTVLGINLESKSVSESF